VAKLRNRGIYIGLEEGKGEGVSQSESRNEGEWSESIGSVEAGVGEGGLGRELNTVILSAVETSDPTFMSVLRVHKLFSIYLHYIPHSTVCFIVLKTVKLVPLRNDRFDCNIRFQLLSYSADL
jgi:hypothetical protein